MAPVKEVTIKKLQPANVNADMESVPLRIAEGKANILPITAR